MSESDEQLVDQIHEALLSGVRGYNDLPFDAQEDIEDVVFKLCSEIYGKAYRQSQVDTAYAVAESRLCKLYLELANVVPANCLSSREIKLRGLLKEARQYVSDAGSFEEPGEHQQALLSDIDQLLSIT
jgi:hypothetical protein